MKPAALTIFYHGVPEVLTKAELEAYLVQALSRIKKAWTPLEIDLTLTLS